MRITHNLSSSVGLGFAGLLNGVAPTGGKDRRKSYSAIYDHIYTVSPTLILNAKVALTAQRTRARGLTYGTFQASTLGFPASTLALFPFTEVLPNIRPSGWSAIGHDGAQKTGGQIGTLSTSANKIFGSHNARLGFEARLYRDNTVPGGSGVRIFSDPDYTKVTDNSATFQGQGGAAFLLGVVTGSTQLRNLGSRSVQSWFHGFYFQDDWKLTPKLTVNLGLRYERRCHWPLLPKWWDGRCFH